MKNAVDLCSLIPNNIHSNLRKAYCDTESFPATNIETYKWSNYSSVPWRFSPGLHSESWSNAYSNPKPIVLHTAPDPDLLRGPVCLNLGCQWHGNYSKHSCGTQTCPTCWNSHSMKQAQSQSLLLPYFRPMLLIVDLCLSLMRFFSLSLSRFLILIQLRSLSSVQSCLPPMSLILLLLLLLSSVLQVKLVSVIQLLSLVHLQLFLSLVQPRSMFQLLCLCL